MRGGPPSEGGGPMSDKEIKSYLSFAAGRQRTGAREGCISRTPLAVALKAVRTYGAVWSRTEPYGAVWSRTERYMSRTEPYGAVRSDIGAVRSRLRSYGVGEVKDSRGI